MSIYDDVDLSTVSTHDLEQEAARLRRREQRIQYLRAVLRHEVGLDWTTARLMIAAGARLELWRREQSQRVQQ